MFVLTHPLRAARAYIDIEVNTASLSWVWGLPYLASYPFDSMWVEQLACAIFDLGSSFRWEVYGVLVCYLMFRCRLFLSWRNLGRTGLLFDLSTSALPIIARSWAFLSAVWSFDVGSSWHSWKSLKFYDFMKNHWKSINHIYFNDFNEISIAAN